MFQISTHAYTTETVTDYDMASVHIIDRSNDDEVSSII